MHSSSNLTQVVCGLILAYFLVGCDSSTVPSTPSPTSNPSPTPTPTSTPIPALQPDFLEDPRTACFIHQMDNAITCLDKDGWHVYASDDFKYPKNPPSFITQCPDGRIYLGYPFAILKGEVLVEIKSDDIPGDKIACGPGNEIWVSVDKGVSHFNGSTWIYYPATEYLGSGEFVDQIKDIAIAPKGTAWVATAQSIASFDGTNWKVFEKGSGFEGNPSFEVLNVDSLGNVWASHDSTLLKYDGVQWSTIEKRPGTGTILCITFDDENRVWVGTYEGIFVFDQNTNIWVLKFVEGTLSGGRVNAMQFDRQGRLWAATDYGFDIYDGSAWTSYQMHTADLFDNTADDVIVFGDGPQLPALAPKAPGSVRGKLVNQDSTPYTNTQVELCLKSVIIMYFGATPCADQPFHVVATVEADGNFVFSDIPVGKYHLMIQKDKDTWDSRGTLKVNPGEETQLGEIDSPPG